MLKKFEVENFKGFEKNIVLDLSAREYEFNKNIVVNDVVNKAIIYGKNGVGKSSLGIAIFDIVGHLTDKERMPTRYLMNYLNLKSKKQYATFKYTFQFDEDLVIYEYAKRDPNNLIYEKLIINQNVVIDDNNNLTVDFHIIVAYGVSISTVCDNLINTVRYSIEEMTGMNVKAINIFVEGVRVID